MLATRNVRYGFQKLVSKHILIAASQDFEMCAVLQKIRATKNLTRIENDYKGRYFSSRSFQFILIDNRKNQ